MAMIKTPDKSRLKPIGFWLLALVGNTIGYMYDVLEKKRYGGSPSIWGPALVILSSVGLVYRVVQLWVRKSSDHS